MLYNQAMKTLVNIILILFVVLVVGKLVILWMEQKMLYYPHKALESTPESLRLAYEDVYIQTQDGQKLHGWWIPAKPKAYTVLYFHGNAGNISHRLHRAKFFQDMGWNLLIIDYRGYGKSTGRPDEKGLYLDAQAAYAFLMKEKGIKPKQLIVYGKSLGGAVAADLCAQQPAAALVLESTFTSTTNMGRMMFPWFPVHLVLSQKYDTLSKLPRLKLPMLIVHGRGDDLIPFSHGEMLFREALEPKQFVPFWGEHNDEVYVSSGEYRKVLAGFAEGL